MAGDWLIALELLLVLGLALGFGLFELWSLRRARRRERQSEPPSG
jgi:hypothetical protein